MASGMRVTEPACTRLYGRRQPRCRLRGRSARTFGNTFSRRIGDWTLHDLHADLVPRGKLESCGGGGFVVEDGRRHRRRSRMGGRGRPGRPIQWPCGRRRHRCGLQGWRWPVRRGSILEPNIVQADYAPIQVSDRTPYPTIGSLWRDQCPGPAPITAPIGSSGTLGKVRSVPAIWSSTIPPTRRTGKPGGRDRGRE